MSSSLTSGPIWSRGFRLYQGSKVDSLLLHWYCLQAGSFTLEKLAAASSEGESLHHTISKKVSLAATPEEASATTVHLSGLIWVRCLSLNHLLCKEVGVRVAGVALFKGNRPNSRAGGVKIPSKPHVWWCGGCLPKNKWVVLWEEWMLDRQPQCTWIILKNNRNS